VRHYHLTGRVTALNTKDQTVSVDQAAIPNWMEAMTMEYPVKSKSEFNTLHIGDKIQATVNVHGEGDYDLSDIQKQAPGK
jgi:Cu/Ag efflux protein CusF